MTYRFTTPTISEGPLGAGPLFSRYRLPRGISVLKIDNVYYEMRTPSEEDVAEASNVYIGGYSYEVNASEKTALEAAGYTVETV